MKTLITGSSGFIGRHLLNMYPDALEFDKKTLVNSINIETLNILDIETLKKAMVGVERVFHLAALSDATESISSPRKYWENNVIGTRNVIAAMDPEAQLIFASSVAVEDVINPYGLTKKVSEIDIIAFCGSPIRFCNVFGQWNLKGVIYNFIVQALRGDPIQIKGNGLQVRSFLWVKDLCNEFTYGGPDVINGTVINIKDLAHIIRAVCNSNSRFVFTPMVDREIDKSCFDNSKSPNIFVEHLKTLSLHIATHPTYYRL